MRIWLSGPRILGGLIRPGISFSLSELTKPSRRKRGGELHDTIAKLADPTVTVNITRELRSLQHGADAPNADPSPAIEFAKYPLRARIAAWGIFGFAIWGFISIVGCAINLAHVGTCHYYSDGPDSVTACEDGSVIVRHQDGRGDR